MSKLSKITIQSSDSDSSDSQKKNNKIRPMVKDDKFNIAKALNKFSLISKEFQEFADGWKEITTERIEEIMITIESKNKEYENLIKNKEEEFKNKNKILEEEFKNKNKILEEEYKDKNKILEEKYREKNIDLEHEFKNFSMENKLKFREDEMKTCEEISKKNNYKLMLLNDYEKIFSELEITKEKLAELETTFNNKLIEKIESEKQIVHEKIKHDIDTKVLNHKAEIAEIMAENKQQLKEIEFLNKLIINLTNEVSEQRTLTKEIAQASSKAQIKQSFQKD